MSAKPLENHKNKQTKKEGEMLLGIPTVPPIWGKQKKKIHEFFIIFLANFCYPKED